MLRHFKILIVEDQEPLRKLLAYNLGKLYTVREAANGEQALQIIMESTPDLIISDIAMPIMDGFTLHAELQKNERTKVIPFIFITALTKAKSSWRGFRSGVDDYFIKPFDFKRLSERIDILLMRSTFLKNVSEEKRTINGLKVFICYASEDKLVALKIYSKLRSLGASPWIDVRNILPGQKWELEISNNLCHSHLILICLSETSVNKIGYVNREIKLALDLADKRPEDSMYVIPVRLNKCSVPKRLSDLQYVVLFDGEGFDKLLKALRFRATALGVGIF